MDYLKTVGIIVPSLSPDEKFTKLLSDLRQAGFENIIVVNDGSTEEYQHFFESAKNDYHCIVLRHNVNQGKGRALKTAFNYILNEMPECMGAIAVDSDGQHSIADTISCAKALLEHPDDLILGCRDFSTGNVPGKSKFGNVLTRSIFKALCGIKVSDTQTGLRGFSKKLMKTFMITKGERFEYETNMLLETKEKKIGIFEVPIETIYIAGNKSTHFNPLTDSLRIYSLFLKFIFASLSSFIVDIVLFTIFVAFFKPTLPQYYIVISTTLARVLSALYNYYLNKNGVFKSEASSSKAIAKYAFLAIIQLSASAALVTVFVNWLALNATVCKIFVDLFLFIVSFQIQREWVFKN